MNNESIYYRMLLIRKTEKKIEELFSLGLLRGTTHGCIGQEALPVALSELLNLDKDYLCSGHRAHGLAIAFTLKPELLIGEIMGRKCGFAKGIGGSQHIYYKNFFTNGITGGMVPVTTGVAFTLKQQNTNAIATVVFGDGAMNEGYVMEAFNMASMMNLPILFILENNGFAMSTASEYASFGSFEKRIKGFGLPYSKAVAINYEDVSSSLDNAISYVRENRNPCFVEVITHRFCGHSKSDNRAYITAERDEFWRKHDCLTNVQSFLSDEKIKEISYKVDQQISDAYNFCLIN